jgi:hypothetical protein
VYRDLFRGIPGNKKAKKVKKINTIFSASMNIERS